jgi:hypothetical protein
LGPSQAGAQLRDIAAKRIAVGQNEASLNLEFAGGGTLHMEMLGRQFGIDGRVVGTVEPGSALDIAWRQLLGAAVALENGPLAEALVEWAPPDDLPVDLAEVGLAMDAAIEEALRGPTPGVATRPDRDGPQGMALIESLLGRSERLAELATALDGLSVGDVRMSVGEDVRIAAGEEIVATLVVVDGDVDVEGTLDGNVVLVGGRLTVLDGGRILGDVRLADARLAANEGEIEGSVVNVVEDELVDEARIRERISAEVRRDLRDEIRSANRDRDSRDDGVSRFGPVRVVRHTVAGVFEALMLVVILGVLGGGLVFFGRTNLAVVAETARRTPGRAAAVGVAGAFLLLPVWVLGAIALAVSIIGIPVLLAWLPLFPVAVALAAALGYFAVASNVGGWLARKRYPYLDWIRSSNPYTLVVGGVTGLMVPFLVARAARIGGSSLDIVQNLLTAAGALVAVAAVFIGFGAVLLTRAGRRPEFYRGDPFDEDAPWASEDAPESEEEA